MKVHKLLLLFVLLLCSIPLGATSYYLSPTGSDSNSGMTPAAAWLSPNHAVNCGDTIIAAASNSYSYANFGFGKWGTVNCAAGNNVAWLTCATFDACKINFSASLQPGMEVSASYWGVQGWEIDGTKATGPCFEAWPWTTWNHIIFANNIANGCGLSGFSTSNSGSANSIDYIAIVGNIAYNSAGGTYYCGSGISVYEPIASDSLPGTHIYIAGIFPMPISTARVVAVAPQMEKESTWTPSTEARAERLYTRSRRWWITTSLLATAARGWSCSTTTRGPGRRALFISATTRCGVTTPIPSSWFRRMPSENCCSTRDTTRR